MMETDKKNSGRRQGSLVSDVVLKSLVSDAVLNCEEKKIERVTILSARCTCSVSATHNSVCCVSLIRL